MDVNIILPPLPDERWTLATQTGIDTAAARFWGVDEPWWTE